jgi:hypothetical protein
MIKQRILYVGIGGSGLDLGIQFDAALKRELCGLDGNALRDQHLPPNTLPAYVQQVYIDLAANAVNDVTSQIGGDNVRTVTGVIPAIASFRNVATSLRGTSANLVDAWLPPPSKHEPLVSPLSAGAGQYPTVGRAALFQSVQEQGLDNVIKTQIKSAIAALAQANIADSYEDRTAVYVGFSLSGGTGCGLFYDVLTILIDCLNDVPGTKTVIIPTVMMPSTFEGNLSTDIMLRAKLNAAPALIDLANMIEKRSQGTTGDNSGLRIEYPGAGGAQAGMASLASNVEIPAVAIISGIDGLRRKDLERILATAMVSQVNTTVQAGGSVAQTQSFSEIVVNIMTDLTQTPGEVMHKPLMPMVSASITLPSQMIVDYVAKCLLSEAFSNTTSKDDAEELKNLGDEILRYSNLGFLVDGQMFDSAHNTKFVPPRNIGNKDELNSKIQSLKNQISSQALPVVGAKIDEALGAMTTFDILAGIQQVLKNRADVSLPTALAAARVALESLKYSTTPSQQSGANDKGPRQQRNRLPFIGRRLTQQEVNTAFANEEKKYTAQVLSLWREKWMTKSSQWQTSYHEGLERIRTLGQWWDLTLGTVSTSRDELKSELITEQSGVKNFIPTAGLSVDQALQNIVTETRNALYSKHQVVVQTPQSLVQMIIGAPSGANASAVSEAVRIFQQNLLVSSFSNVLISSLKSEILSVISKSNAGQPPALRTMAALLEDMVSANPSSDAKQFQSDLSSIMPNNMVPTGNHHKIRVVITYPGLPNQAVTAGVAKNVFSSGAMQQLLSLGINPDPNDIVNHSEVSISAVGDSDTITVNINKIGQSLFDNVEVCEIMRTFQAELESSADLQKLKYRQRLGYRDMDKLLRGDSRTNMLNKLLIGLWGGLIRVDEGTEDEPFVLRIAAPTYDDSHHPLIMLKRSGAFSGWSSIVWAFEQLLIKTGDGTSGFQKNMITDMLGYEPETLNKAEAAVPSVIESILKFRATAITEAMDAVSGKTQVGTTGLEDQRRVLDFWTNDFPKAWKLRESGTYLESLNSYRPLD